ncbi:hypothetical protein [Sinomonas atrocyanea]|uniref:hypothetical protein n=1 Tax=Sinomonas atrocyanea TaxID=37927 RepID=UPI0027871B94|nr:hypothetical protein [Sinomonas atrocyanea]MDQ0259543.1 hypothetical protein [Sinomonas atrocyanea]MDR6623198.1 hypothetical protein [Sinomonas atrocyanea]
MVDAEGDRRRVDILRGSAVVGLIITSPEWVHRRVDGIVLGPDGETTRSSSYDFTLPRDAPAPGPDGRVLLPLSFIRKGALRRFSATGPDGRTPAPVLTRTENTAVAAGMLASFFPDDAKGGDLEQLILDVVDYADGSADGEEALGRLLDGARQALEPNAAEATLDQALDVFESLARTLMDHFVLLVEVDARILGMRSIVKISYEQELVFRRRPWEHTTVFTFPVPDFGSARSHHVEVTVPAALSIRELSLRDKATHDHVLDRPEGNAALGHVSLSPGHRFSQATVRVEACPAQSGITGFTTVANIAVFLLTALLVLEKIGATHLLARGLPLQSSAASVVLFAPALLLSWLARTAEHDLVRVLFKPLRFSLGLFALFFLTLGVLAAGPLTMEGRAVAWALVWIASGIGILGFLGYRLNVRRLRLKRRGE